MLQRGRESFQPASSARGGPQPLWGVLCQRVAVGSSHKLCQPLSECAARQQLDCRWSHQRTSPSGWHLYVTQTVQPGSRDFLTVQGPTERWHNVRRSQSLSSVYRPYACFQFSTSSRRGWKPLPDGIRLSLSIKSRKLGCVNSGI